MLSSVRGLWSRHRRKFLFSLGAAGCGYLIYRFYDARNRRIAELRSQFEQSTDEDAYNQLELHFEVIQRVCDTKTLPNSMYYLKSRLDEDLDLSYLKEKLMQGKTQTSVLSKKEKLELWENLKVLSFTRMVSSLWSMTMLCLYVRILVNILGRKIYFEFAHGSSSFDDDDSFSRPGQQDFLASADYLSTFGIGSLIAKMHTASMEIVQEKQLNEPITVEQLRETIMQILDLFITSDAPNYWISYLVPPNATEYKQQMVVPSDGLDDPSALGAHECEQLILEAQSVLSSSEFANIMEMSLKAVVDELIKDIADSVGGTSSSIPLAKLLPQLGLPLLNQLNCDLFVQALQRLPEVELFYKLLYANMPQ